MLLTALRMVCFRCPPRMNMCIEAGCQRAYRACLVALHAWRSWGVLTPVCCSPAPVCAEHMHCLWALGAGFGPGTVGVST